MDAGFRLLVEDELKQPLRRGKQRGSVTYKDDERIVRMLPTYCEKRKRESGLTETEAIREVVLRLPQTQRSTVDVDAAVRRLRQKMKAQPVSPLKHHLMFLPPPPVEAKQTKQRNKRR